MTEQDVKDIKSDLAEIKSMLRKAGFTNHAPQKVVDLGKRAREIKERLDKRNDGSTDRP